MKLHPKFLKREGDYSLHQTNSPLVPKQTFLAVTPLKLLTAIKLILVVCRCLPFYRVFRTPSLSAFVKNSCRSSNGSSLRPSENRGASIAEIINLLFSYLFWSLSCQRLCIDKEQNQHENNVRFYVLFNLPPRDTGRDGEHRLFGRSPALIRSVIALNNGNPASVNS